MVPSVIWVLLLTACLPGTWGCDGNEDCIEARQCVAGKCVNPCASHECPPNHHCKAFNHQAVCSCPPENPRCADETPGCGTDSGCPDNQACVSQKCVDPCPSKGCAQNTACRVANHQATCECVDSTGALCSAIFLPQCNKDQDCPTARACAGQRCVNPCTDYCGENAVCSVDNHYPNCACSPGFTGDPNKKCEPQGNQISPSSGIGGNFPLGPSSLRKKKYLVFTKYKANWHGALVYCMTHGYRLATIFTKEENDQLKEEIRKTYIRGGQFWTSGTDHPHEGKWFWVTTGLPYVGFTDWKAGQPDNFFAEACMELWEADQNIGYQWNDRTCSEHHYFVCEYYE